MKKTLAILILVVSAHCGSSGAEPIPDFAKQKCPQCYQEYVKYSYTVSLPEGMRKALKEYSPAFRLFKMSDFAEELRLRPEPGVSNLSAYSAIFNDFNGDGRFDAALLGEVTPDKHETEGFIILAILSEGATGYKVVEVAALGVSRPVTTFLKLARPGKVSEAGQDSESVDLKNYGILQTMGYGTTVYYWDATENKFKSIATGGV
ncbi:MAG: hypothetical protein WCK75_05025 [Elusimicrobiota bacterium]